MLIERKQTYEEMCAAFRWRIPAAYNIAHDVSDRHVAATPDRVALIHERADGTVETYTFLAVQHAANRLANLLRHVGVGQGERVMILLGQDPATAIAHLACWKSGIVSIPTSILFGADALLYRLNDAGAKVVITNRENYAKIAEIRDQAPSLETVLLVDGDDVGAQSLWAGAERASDRFDTLSLTPDTPAFISYTSGTTGLPKGTLHGHRVLLGHMPGVEFMLDFFPQPGDITWSPADWSWLAGLMNILMPGWFAGVPVLTWRASSFDADEALRMIAKHQVRTAMLTPTMLKLMRQSGSPHLRDVKLRAVVSGSEAVGKDLLEWANGTLGLHINEGFGQTECNMAMGNCWQVLPPRLGSLGKAVPGQAAAIVDDAGEELPPGTTGNLAFRRGHPAMFLEYWKRPEATAEKYAGDWMITGDMATMDGDGYFWYQGRGDDVITSSGYRIGPGEIEDALVRHPAVVMAAAIGVPDPVRTETIKAFVILAPGHAPSPELADDIRKTVRSRLAKHEYPREIEFIDAMPMTTTGKILRRELRERETAKIKTT
ncbi:acyl-CoA synthetase [Chelatococcus reniformis]|uniref:Acetyl-CoA synthetase n=1 Tax=Chelatococcus reniformis TaxID=1494448 RepID=A0A916U7M0_9HYPH|nr:AMP-binding protein [Chelatococcus reniformis]GGC62475.1 acetyl-CoA synthetase [Chelatococcus reniformis]